MSANAFTLPDLPYAQDALEPNISANTISFHYGKHHQGYVNKLNAAVEGTDDAGKSLEELVTTSSGKIFNLAAQTWNHTFYWNCMTPDSTGEPEADSAIGKAIAETFGDFAAFKTQFLTAAGHFGSGWAWLCKDKDGKLVITDTADAGNPLTEGLTPILTCDVWEHAYYLDVQNNRGQYLENWFNLVNWSFVNDNFLA
eukprot:TRINITY_DN921_c0_g2_i1.p1 TRINITY_DN921_c0_g2~~TRINITY_DN921_c0_g2_i1.p1  ORF type:complete len:198 (-),score=49.31 TRINITY_DN921_c0_g2_i1:285-878(-)